MELNQTLQAIRNRDGRYHLFVDLSLKDEVDELVSLIRWLAETKEGYCLGIDMCRKPRILSLKENNHG